MIPVFKPLLEKEEHDAAHAALELGWLGLGSYVNQFELGIRELIDAPDRHVVAVNTGHSALHLAFLLIGAGPGDEIITPSFNNIADFQAILATGAEPVFCDIDDSTLCIDLKKAEELITPKTKAIVVMDYDCVLADHDAVAELQKRHPRIRIIHDAAHAFGSKYKGRPIGSFSDIAMFSFDPVKTITCIDGGALVVKTREEVEALHEMRLIGMGQPSSLMYQNQRAWTYDVKRLGFRYHMANLHGAIGLAQLAKFERISTTRRATALFYNEALKNIPDVRTPETDFHDITPFLYYIRVPEDRRDALRAYMKEQGIDTGIHWQPGHWFTLLSKFRRGDLSVTDRVGKEILSLPLHSCMAEADRQAVVDSVASFFGVTAGR
jgi:dTDP-4-amino-4,6-dideoxygalactose transaminase